MKINASRTDEEISRLSYFMYKETKMPIEIVKRLVLLKAEIVLFSKNIIWDSLISFNGPVQFSYYNFKSVILSYSNIWN